MTTPQIVKDSVVNEQLFGFAVQTIIVDGTEYYLAPSVFRHFGAVMSQQFREHYTVSFPGLSRAVVTYAKLHDYCRFAMSQERLRHKSRLMMLISQHQEPQAAVPQGPQGVNAGALKVPDTVTVEAQQLEAIVKQLGIGRVHTILEKLGLLEGLCNDAASSAEDVEKPRRTVKITIEY